MNVERVGLEQVKTWVGGWTAYAALGSFLLYLMGYLSLRFQLSAWGVKADLSVFDERYLFAGASYLVYSVAIIPVLILLALILAALAYAIYRVGQRTMPPAVKTACHSIRHRIDVWWSAPNRLALAGLVGSVLFIQLYMTQCFVFTNLLLAKSLECPWFSCNVILGDSVVEVFYFSASLVGTLATAAVYIAVHRQPPKPFSKWFDGALGLLVGIEFLLLPVNHGILIASKQLPRLSALGSPNRIPPGADAWLVWEGTEGVTYLVRTHQGEGKGDNRALVTVRKQAVENVQICCYDSIFQQLFAGRRPCE